MDKNQQTVPLARLDKIKDIGVYFDAKLDFRDHMHEKINKAYMMLGLINRNFKHMPAPANPLRLGLRLNKLLTRFFYLFPLFTLEVTVCIVNFSLMRSSLISTVCR